MRNILLTISYDGTDFCGWQRQDSRGGRPLPTVQGSIEEALERLHGQPVPLHGSGRTDSGVHALGQAANFFSPMPSIPVENYARALNALLPPGIRIMDAEERPEQFDARFCATSRVYRYFLSAGAALPATLSRYVWSVRHLPDIGRLNDMARVLRGEMDCASFAAAGDASRSTFRYLEGARFFERPSFPGGRPLLVFEIEANAFLWKMVRTIVGTLLDLDRRGCGAESFREVVERKDRASAGATAPPNGLFLYRVRFDGIRRHV